MAKPNISVTIIPEARQALEALGDRLRASRIDQNLTVAQMAEKMLCAINTYRDLEAGKPTASLGNFANALLLLGQLDTLRGVAPVPATLATGRRAKRRQSGKLTLSSSDLDF